MPMAVLTMKVGMTTPAWAVLVLEGFVAIILRKFKFVEDLGQGVFFHKF